MQDKCQKLVHSIVQNNTFSQLLFNDRVSHLCITTHTNEVSMGFPLSVLFIITLNNFSFANCIAG
jgi:hypothetical protein